MDGVGGEGGGGRGSGGGEGGREGGAEERRGVYIASCLEHRLFPAGGSSSLVKGGSGNGPLGERRSGWRGGHAGRGDTVHVGGGLGRRSTGGGVGGGVGGLRAPSLLSTQWVGVLDRIPGMGWRGGDLSARPKCASPGPEYLYGTVVSGWGDVGAAVREGLGVGTPSKGDRCALSCSPSGLSHVVPPWPSQSACRLRSCSP